MKKPFPVLQKTTTVNVETVYSLHKPAPSICHSSVEVQTGILARRPDMSLVKDNRGTVILTSLKMKGKNPKPWKHSEVLFGAFRSLCALLSVLGPCVFFTFFKFVSIRVCRLKVSDFILHSCCDLLQPVAQLHLLSCGVFL